jgi:hypothetical protein
VKVFIENFIQGANARDRVFFAVNEQGFVIQVIESDSRRVVVVYDEAAQAEETGCTAIYVARALMLARAQAEAAKRGGGLVGADGVPVAKG